MAPTKNLCLVIPSLLVVLLHQTLDAQYGMKTIDYRNDSLYAIQEIQNIKKLPDESFIPFVYRALPYRLFTPIKKKHARSGFPLIVVFHHSGQIGTDNISQLGLLPKLFARDEIQRKYPAYILAPQFSTRSSDYMMDDQRGVLTSAPRACLHDALSLIDSLRHFLHIDSRRIYAVGFSMGGSTVINALNARPDLFAAGISIAGIPQFDHVDAIRGIPVWLIHGIDDDENPIASDEEFYKEISKEGHILFWKMEDTHHGNVFTPRLLGRTMPRWLYRHARNNH